MARRTDTAEQASEAARAHVRFAWASWDAMKGLAAYLDVPDEELVTWAERLRDTDALYRAVQALEKARDALQPHDGEAESDAYWDADEAVLRLRPEGR